VDSNCNPDGIDYIIPGNDDAGRAITLYCDLVSRAAIDGLERSATRGGVDIGASEHPTGEDLGEKGGRKGRNSKGARSSDRDDAAAASATPAQLSGFTPLTSAQGEPDDLIKLNGVGKGWARKLNEAGIYHFWQIAELSPENLEELDEAFNAKGKIAKSSWIDEAKKLKDGAAEETEKTAS
jgi:small subunit ribosomal protein S2